MVNIWCCVSSPEMGAVISLRIILVVAALSVLADVDLIDVESSMIED